MARSRPKYRNDLDTDRTYHNTILFQKPKRTLTVAALAAAVAALAIVAALATLAAAVATLAAVAATAPAFG